MSERYSKLFALPENLYATGSPVVIAAGALLKDNQTGKVLAQLKLRNIGKKTIKAATVSVEPLDTVGKPLGAPVTYQYLDLHADRDADFGQKTPIALPDSATRSFAVSVVQVIFTDNSIWNDDSPAWNPLSRPKSLDAMGDGELVKQFRIEYGGGCENLLLEQKDLWHCVCGAVNRQEEANCHKCGKALAELQAIDMDDLLVKKDERVAKERAEVETVRKEAQKKAQKIKKITAIVIPVLIVVIVATVIISEVVKKNNAYDNALALLENGQYEEAIQAFLQLEEYKECTAKIKYAEQEKAYSDAISLLESKQFKKAIEAFENMGEYRDSTQMILETKYQWALYCLDISDDHLGYELLSELVNVDYKDVGAHLDDFCYLPSSVSINDSEEYECDYDTHGNVIKGLLKLVPDYSVFFDENSYVFPNETFAVWPIFDEISYSYNDDGSYSYTCSYQVTDSITIQYTFDVDSKGQCVSKVRNWCYDGNVDAHQYKFEYYDDGQYRKLTCYANNEIRWTRDFSENGEFRNGSIDDHNNITADGNGNRFTYDYDEYGRLFHRELPAYNMYSDYFYDENGYLVKQVGIGKNGKTQSYNIIYAYDWFYCPDYS